MGGLIFEEETFRIRGAVFEVYREMGSGYAEPVYQECLRMELTSQKIPFIAQPELRIRYKGEVLAQFYKPDFICYDHIVIELKAARALAPEHEAQLMNYLKATGMKLGLLINFGAHPRAEIKRIAH
ncbi:hypothetical protein OJF2_38070 [Aquisphaera giovannonii]|uniref:GxxExxY protein n=1 Tax=Aquisphaera giovannonii TaxID=406548 RepID=A0A5B9W4U2_9BACT|nr:GxxExxY protein [Aquisphaera giovannonii]QEH35259.1 hypothetical protein OJF2_38070 [Aquisphaera giovannonii]